MKMYAQYTVVIQNKKKAVEVKGFGKNIGCIIILFHKSSITYLYHLGPSSPKRAKKSTKEQ